MKILPDGSKLTNLQYSLARVVLRGVKKRSRKGGDQMHCGGVNVDPLVERKDIYGRPLTDSAIKVRGKTKVVRYLEWHNWMWDGSVFIH